jgi:hypothetical protein
VCPRSFPISPQSFYFLDLYGRTFGGKYGTDLVHLPLGGGVVEQPNIFFEATDIIRSEHSKYVTKKMENSLGSDNKVSRETNMGASNKGEAITPLGRK